MTRILLATTARSIRLRSWRTLPGQEKAISRSIAFRQGSVKVVTLAKLNEETLRQAHDVLGPLA
jgi:hypothetical protein